MQASSATTPAATWITIAFYTAVLTSLARTLLAIPLDNGLIGEPEIECGPVSIAINFATLNVFVGHVYVKGRFDEPGCRSDENGREVASISIPFSTCGVLRERSLNPRGLFASTIVIITFHPYFLTKVDRAYNVKCFYMEADKVLEGGPEGKPVSYALVGMQVYHKWICESETTETFCMRVHSCYVEDGRNQSVEYLDDSGCAIDKYILANIQYISDLNAGQESHVYKFADRSQLLFKCQITISIKEPGIDCPRPACALQRRYRRNIDGIIGSVDVSRALESLDIDITNAEALSLLQSTSAFCISPSEMDLQFMFLLFPFAIFGLLIMTKLGER